jgi:hypothetical protein
VAKQHVFGATGIDAKQLVMRGVEQKSRLIMTHTMTECLEHARECEWYAAHTGNEEDRLFLLRKAKEWAKQAREKELEIRAAARVAA